MIPDEIVNLKNYPICDTDIWVDIILAKIDSLLFSKYEKIVIADVVEWEILQFQKDEYSKCIAEKYLYYKNRKDIIIINHSDINEEDRKLLEKQLKDCDNRFQNGLVDFPHEKHKGEIVSAIYAEYLKLSFLKSNDGTFKDGNMGRIAFPDLVVKDRRDTLMDLVDSERKRKECLQLIIDSRELMNEGTRIYETSTASEEQIEKLLRKWKKH